MPEKQVRALYGDPDTVTSSGDGETWTYTKGMGRMFIPFAGGFHASQYPGCDVQ
jgi:hypothetical protein